MLQNLRLPVRLGLAFGLVLILVMAMAALGVIELRRIDALNNDQDATVEKQELVRLWRSTTELNLARGMVLAKSGNNSTIVDMLDGPMKASTKKISELTEALSSKLTDGQEKALLDAALDERKKYSALRSELFKRMRQGDVVGVEEDADKLLAPAGTAYMAKLDALTQHLDGIVTGQVQAQTAAARSGQWILLAISAVAVLAGAALSWAITRSVVAPLQSAIKVTQRVAEGDLSEVIETDRQDELGDLLKALGGMQQSLRSLVGEVRAATDSIGTASSEIKTGNTDLSARTEQTASSLQETASSMEQLTGTVQQTADSARTANQLAATAADTAQRGGQVVSEVVQNMEEISTASRKISDIIGVIDGIAFQTNILALNAAVEAARAGEQGRGFAVVAAEVRSLAGRSAEAAREIKSLISASVERVESGARLVESAGSTMQEIVGSVQRVTDIIGEITAAAAEQSDGIRQVNGAVTQLDQMTQQNAALVEESAAAAESLKDQADSLARVVARFQLAGQGHAAPARSALASAPAPRPATQPAPAQAHAPVSAPRAASPAPQPATASAKPLPVLTQAVSPAPAPAVASTAHADSDWESF